MRISKSILNQTWLQAAIEQTAIDYQSQGYSIQKQVTIADMQADLVAQKDNNVIFFEFKSGKWDTAKVNQALKLRNYVVNNQAGKFKLVFVNTPEEKQVQIDGLKDILYNLCLEKAIPELRNKLTTQITLKKVSDIEISYSKIIQKEIQVKGSVIAHFQVEADKESFLANFYLTLSHDLELKTLHEFNFDLSSFL
jgi:hypothetical protein